MRIEGAHSNPALLRTYRNDIENLLDQPSDREMRPCPGCNLTCPACGSQSCNCQCTAGCDDAPRMMSAEPEDLPIEAGIISLVYALNCLRLLQPCWSCEGHVNKAGDLEKPPRVWFYARSVTYPDSISELLYDLDIAKRLSLAWQVSVVRWGDGPDVAFSIEPRIRSAAKPELMKLRRDARIIADSLMTDMKIKLRHRIHQIDQMLNE